MKDGYDEIMDGYVVKPPVSFYLACCDCGLVHELKITILKNNKVKLVFERDERRTSQFRRYGLAELQKNDDEMWKLTRNRKVKNNAKHSKRKT
jgi:uncharacterized Zn finger protein